MLTWGFPNDTTVKKPSYLTRNKNKEFEQPRKIQALYVELNPDRDEENVDVTNPSNEHPELASKVDEPIWLRILKCSQTTAGTDVLPGQMPNPSIVKPNSPSSNDKSDGNLSIPNLDSTKGWDPNRTQRLKRKYYTWAAIQAADRKRSNGNGGGQSGRNDGNRNNGHGNQQERSAPISHDIPMHLTQTSSRFDHLPEYTCLQYFVPVPGDIIISLQCRPIQQNNPYFNPGGHCYLYTDEAWLDRERSMHTRQRAYREGIFQAQPQFLIDDLIVRAGKMDYAYNWIPQKNVEVYRHMVQPTPWLFYGRVPYEPLLGPITYASGDASLAHRTVHGRIPGFRPQRGDLIIREGNGFTTLAISYYHHQRTPLEPGLILLRAGYGRVENSLVATVEMYQYLQNATSAQVEWIFQGRDIQIYGGTQTLESLIHFVDPHASAAPHPESTPEDIALADSYLNL